MLYNLIDKGKKAGWVLELQSLELASNYQKEKFQNSS
jgi:hypothetical protein